MAVPSYIKDALKNEVKGYNLNSDTENLIIERVLGTAEATYDFDPNFRATLAAASPADREKIIREFLRDYVKKEIHFETSNLENQIKRVSDFHFGTGFKLSDINAKKKTFNKDGSRNFKPYENIRSKITEHFLPEDSEASKASFTSQYKSDVDKVAKDFNDGKINLTTAQNEINDLNTKFNNGIGVQVFDEDFGDFIDHRMSLIKQRVEAAEGEGDLFFGSKADKLRLLNDLYSSNTSNVDKYIPKGRHSSNSSRNDFKDGLIRQHTDVSINSSGKMVVKGDGIFEYHEGSLKKFKDQTPSNHEGAYATLVQGNLVTSVTDLSYVAETTSDAALKTRVTEAKDRIGFVNDLININNARLAPAVSASGAAAVASTVGRVTDAILGDKLEFKDDNERDSILNSLHVRNGAIAVSDFDKRITYTESKGGVTFASATQKTAFLSSLGTGDLDLKDISSKIDAAEAAGDLTFRSKEDKEKFVRSFREAHKDALNNFIQPSISGNGTFANWVDQINNEILDIGGAASNTSLASRAINFFNNHNSLNRAKLNNFIYMAQMVTDPGYAVHEIKKKFREDVKKYLGFDTEANLKSFIAKRRKESLKSFVGYINNTLYKGSKDKELKVEDFENLKEINSDFKGYLKKWAKSKLKDKLTKFFATSKFLEKYGLNFNYNEGIFKGFSWKLLGQSKYGRLAKLALNKFGGRLSNYLGQALKLGVNKIPYLGPIISKLASKYFPSRYLGRTANGLINAFTEAGAKIGTGGGLINRTARLVLIGCSAWIVLFVVLVLSIMFVVLGALSSNSGTPYLPGSSADVTFGTFESFDQNLAFKGGRITTSGNICVSPNTGNAYTADRPQWNNLRLSDFEGTDNSNNCRIMCNARKIMGGLQPGKDGALNCNYNFPDLYNHDIPGSFHNTQFWCTQLIMKSYRDDDPGIDTANNALVITMDAYLRRNSDKYDRVDLAVPNDPNNLATLTQYNPICIDRSNFQPGNIVIMRNNTCNDVGGGKYKTYNGAGQLVETSSAHVEMVLKLSGDTLTTISTNNLLKKLTYSVSSSGCPSGQVKINSKTKGYVGGVLTDMYLCRMFQKKQTGSYTCDTSCDIPPNNYPERIFNP